MYINSFKNSEEFKAKWNSIDDDKSDYLDEEEFIKIEPEHIWKLYSNGGITIHKP